MGSLIYNKRNIWAAFEAMGKAKSSMMLPYKIMRELLNQRAGMKPVLCRVAIAFLGNRIRSANEILYFRKVVEQISGPHKPLKIVRAVPVRCIPPNGAVLNQIKSC